MTGMENRPSDDEHRPSIEFEPLSLVGVERHVGYTAPQSGANVIDGGPVPQRPEHRCPNCDYILAGLTSRRCPECGEPFTVLEARLRGLELSDGIRQAMRSDRKDEIRKYVGLLLVLASVELQNVLAGDWLALSPRGMLMLTFMAPLWLGILLFKQLRDENWAYACWVAGLVAIVFSGVLAIM